MDAENSGEGDQSKETKGRAVHGGLGRGGQTCERGLSNALKGRGATKYSTIWASGAVMDVHKTLARAWPERSLEGRRVKRGLRVSDVCLTRSVRGGEAKVRTDHDPASAPGVCGEGPTGRDAPILRLAWCGEAQKTRFIFLLAGLLHVCFISRYLSLLDSSLVVSLQPCQRHPRHRQWGWGSSIWSSAAGGARDPPNEAHGSEKQTTITEEEEGWLPCAVHGDSLPFPAYIFPTPLFRAPSSVSPASYPPCPATRQTPNSSNPIPRHYQTHSRPIAREMAPSTQQTPLRSSSPSSPSVSSSSVS
jgi:hypothetical protein